MYCSFTTEVLPLTAPTPEHPKWRGTSRLLCWRMLGFFGFLLALPLLLLSLFQLLLFLRMLLLCLLLMLLLHPLFLRLIRVLLSRFRVFLLLLLLQPLAFLFLLCAQLFLLLLLLHIHIGVRGLRRCCSGGWRLIVGVNGFSCGAIVTLPWRRIVRRLSAFCRSLSRFWLHVARRRRLIGLRRMLIRTWRSVRRLSWSVGSGQCVCAFPGVRAR